MRKNATAMETEKEVKLNLLANGINSIAEGTAMVIQSFQSDFENMDVGTVKVFQLLGTVLTPILNTENNDDALYVKETLESINKTIAERMPDVVDILAMNQKHMVSIMGGLQ